MIDYKNIQLSIDYYKLHNFSRIESPWTVTPYISGLTKPSDKIDYKLEHNKKVLVASGEQSFLYLYLKGFLPKGRYQSVTPCFRDEIFDLTHTKYFMKNELIDTLHVNEENLMIVVGTCFEFFKKNLKDSKDLMVVKTSDTSYDIEYKGIELGSYGIRSCDFLEWIYGTGIAEPRFSTCQKMK